MVFGLTCVTLFSIGWCEPQKQHGTSEKNGLIFKEQPKTLLSRTKRQNEFSAGGIFMRIVSMVAILVGVGMGSGSIAAAGGGALAGTAGIIAANRADEDFQNSVLENCGEQETITLTTYTSICENFNCVANCPNCACANGAATGATAAIGGAIGGVTVTDCCAAAATKACCFCCCLS